MKKLTGEEKETLIKLGQAIKVERIKLGWTVVDLAHKAEMSHQTLYTIEADGKANIIAFFRLADAMGINIARLFISFF